MSRATGKICPKHPNSNWEDRYGDAFFMCDICARKDINLCKCGSHARFFAEALMCSISCESETCKEHIYHVGCELDIREAWNNELRGYIKGPYDD